MRPSDTKRPCKNCGQMWYDHPTLQYRCDVDKLPVQWQEMLYHSQGDVNYPKYEPMDNLRYLEYLSGR